MSFKLQIPFGSTTHKLLFFAIIGLTLGIVSCGPESNGNSASSTIKEAYPAQPEVLLQTDAYPVPANQGDILLAFTKPINLEDSEIRGVGPAGLSIELLNITLMGEQIGAGVIGADGTFSIPVRLQSNIRIGLNANIEAIGLTVEDIQPGDNAMVVPLVGYFYDTVIISGE